MRLLITGGAGFVGSHVAEIAIQCGHEVHVVDNLSTGKEANVPQGAKFLRLDLLDPELPKWISAVSPHAIIHLAAYADLRSNWTGANTRARVLEHNIDTTVALMEAMPDIPLVYTSSASVYGSASDDRGCSDRPFVEDDACPRTCESPYAAAKLACEALILSYAHKRGFPAYVARLVNVVGSRTSHGVISDFVTMMSRDGKIHAADNGHQRKSWVHVDDVAIALLFMAERGFMTQAGLRGLEPGVYNIASTQDISWWDIVDMMGVPRDLVTYEDRTGGAVGDPIGLHVSARKFAEFCRPTRTVTRGILEALDSLGWVRP